MTDSSTASNEVADVVIIGAGVSGLVAARQLCQANKSVVVLEGRDRVGGRLFSRPADSGALDLGATWFWHNEPNVLALIDEFGIKVFEQHLDGDAMYQDSSGSQRMQGNPIDAPSGRFAAGADSLPRAIHAQLPSGTVRFNHQVERVEANDSELVVRSGDSTVVGRHVILAVPPALAVNSITFSPELPERLAGLAAITPVWMGAITKVVIQYDDAFWRRAGLAGAAMSHVGPIRELHDMSGPTGQPAALFGFVPSQSGDATVTKTQVVAQLEQIFGPEAAHPTDVLIHDWRNEPLTSPPGVEQLGAYQTYGHPLYAEPALGGRLHWCSTETAAQAPGHIEGAIVAAHRAVASII